MKGDLRLRKIEAVLFPEAEPDEGPAPGMAALLRYARQHPPGPGEACDLVASSGMAGLLAEARQHPHSMPRPLCEKRAEYPR
jgi:hypothetical protein